MTPEVGTCQFQFCIFSDPTLPCSLQSTFLLNYHPPPIRYWKRYFSHKKSFGWNPSCVLNRRFLQRLCGKPLRMRYLQNGQLWRNILHGAQSGAWQVLGVSNSNKWPILQSSIYKRRWSWLTSRHAASSDIGRSGFSQVFASLHRQCRVP